MYIPACLSQPRHVLLLSCSTVAPTELSTGKPTKRTLAKVRGRDSAGETVLGLKDGESLTVDLHSATHISNTE